ncbi:MAG: hypothetical protein LIP02_03190 [Bacteroidales bacterium]|nr:hypothetical protein [Bacteroidales bacterium]
MPTSTTTIIEPPSLGAVSVSTPRVLWIDLARCLGLWLMVVGHNVFFPEPWKFLYRVIWSFHMPLFFILAGALFHPVGIKERVKKEFWHLAVPSWICVTVALLDAYLSETIPDGTLGHTLAWIGFNYGFCSNQLFDLVSIVGSTWFIGALIINHIAMEQ